MQPTRTLPLFLMLVFGYGAYLYFTPNSLIASLNSFFGTSLPNPLGNLWAFIYAIVPATVSITVAIGVSRDVAEEGSGQNRR